MVSARNTKCKHCGGDLEGLDQRQRFCSENCLQKFQIKHRLSPKKSEFSFQGELSELQNMILDFAKAYTHTDEEERLRFYEEVVERTAAVLTWINGSSFYFEVQAKEQLKGLQAENETLERKLHRLLERAADLKKENKILRSKVKDISVDTLTICRVMLGVNEQADKHQIKQAYRQKAKRIHPDSGGDADVFKALTRAMVLLLANLEMT